MRKILVFIVVVGVVGLVLFLMLNKSPSRKLDIAKTNAQILGSNSLYSSIIAQRIGGDDEFVVSFVVKEEGTKNYYGDIVFSRVADGKDMIVGTFNTSPIDFDTGVILEGTTLGYTETLRFGGDDTTKENKKIELEDFIDAK